MVWLGIAFKGVMAIGTAWWLYDSSVGFNELSAEEKAYARENPLKWAGSSVLNNAASVALAPILTLLLYFGYAFQRTLIEVSDTVYRDIQEVEEDITYMRTLSAYPCLWSFAKMSLENPQKTFIPKPASWSFNGVKAVLTTNQVGVKWTLNYGRPRWNDFTDTRFRINLGIVREGLANSVGTEDELFLGLSFYDQATGFWGTPSDDDIMRTSVYIGDTYVEGSDRTMIGLISGIRPWRFHDLSSDIDADPHLMSPTASSAGSHPSFPSYGEEFDLYTQSWYDGFTNPGGGRSRAHHSLGGLSCNPWYGWDRGEPVRQNGSTMYNYPDLPEFHLQHLKWRNVRRTEVNVLAV